MSDSSRIPHGPQSPDHVNNSFTRHSQNHRADAVSVRLAIAIAAFFVLSGCHYCPYNRYAARPGYRYACDDVGSPYACTPGGRRGRYFTGGACDQGGCLSDSARDPDPYCYYPEPLQPEEPTFDEPGDALKAEADPPSPFAPAETAPEAPFAAVQQETEQLTAPPLPFPTNNTSPEPLFEGRVDAEALEPAVPPPAIVPELTIPSQPSTPPPGETTETPETEEDPGFPRSLFPLEFPPRLFRLRDDDAEPAEPVPPVSEASATSGVRSIGGHSLFAPRHTRQDDTQSAPAASPTTERPAVGSGVFRFGHSL